MIAIDWGTSTFRAYLVAGDGTVIDERRSDDGILAVESGRFAEILDARVSDWLDADAGPALMAGMVGSRQGWIEVPYVPCPAGIAEIGAGLRPVEWGRGRQAWIAPGVSCRDDAGIPDVMRGEEVQVLGALDALASPPEWLCLPGTHSKWVRIANGRIDAVTTHMTGEWFAVAKAHTILRRLIEDGPLDELAFEAGVRRASTPGGLLHHVFGVRALGLFGELAGRSAGSYLSGLLIGHELVAVPAPPPRVPIIGSAALTDLYVRAMAVRGIQGTPMATDLVVRGLSRLSAFVRAHT